MSIDDRTYAAIEGSDTDELIRIVDGQVAARDWEAMVRLRERCDEAVTRGKQLWGVSEYVRYRLALDAPGEWAGPVVSEGASRFTLGPLPEVAASTKTWSDLDAHIRPGPERAMTAHERVVRGERLEEADIDRLVLELPLALQPWEPPYPVATYKADRVDSPTPPVVRFDGDAASAQNSTAGLSDDGSRALLSAVEHWVEHSNGRAQVTRVEADAFTAVSTLGPRRIGLAEVSPDRALAWIAWAGSDGGAYGRRRGAATGRFTAWWVANELAGLEWPTEPDQLGEAIGSLRWYLWNDGSPDTGWALRLAVESPEDGLAWALSAIDAE